MTKPDWRTLAKARQLNIPDPELDRIAAALDGLEQAFRPLAASIPAGVDPAVIFRAEESGE